MEGEKRLVLREEGRVIIEEGGRRGEGRLARKRGRCGETSGDPRFRWFSLVRSAESEHGVGGDGDLEEGKL